MATISIAEHCGLCAGAEKSIDCALAALREGAAEGRPVVLYKEILHNAVVMEKLHGAGAFLVDDFANIPAGALVVVRAHGEGEAFYARAAEAGVELRDATCVNVRRVHELVRDAHAAGRAVVIFGKRGHAEVEGVSGWCGNAAVIIENDGDIAALGEDVFSGSAASSVLAVCQTTAARGKAQRLLALLRERFPGKDIEFVDTICAAPLRIHEPSVRLAAACDILFTIGGAKSSNTAELRAKCLAVGAAECPPQMESCAEFFAYLRANAAKCTPDLRYGFTAGASTPRAEVEKCRDLLAFWLYHREVKARLEAGMTRVNDGFADAENRLLREAAGHFAAVNSGGKHVRGVLANLGWRIAPGASGEDAGYADPLSLAFEVFQTAVLMHDDLIDHATLRRGRKTVPLRYRDAHGDAVAAQETADAMALCLGDWGMFKAVEILSGAYGGTPCFAALVRVFSRMVIRTIQGEIIDTALPFEQRTGISRESGEALVQSIREIHHRKTSWYTTIAPLVCGMLLGGASEADIAVMREFADLLGLAFQMQDDILGVFGDGAALGKDVGSDVAEYKQTLLYAYTQVLRPDLFAELQSLYGRGDLTPEEFSRVKAIFVESGAYANAVAETERCFAQALAALDGAAFLSEENTFILRGLAAYLGLRDH